MFMHIICPYCGHKCRVPERAMGTVMPCECCARKFQCGSVSPPSLEALPVTEGDVSGVQAIPPSRAASLQPDVGIPFRCPSCDLSLAASGKAAGTKTNCPGCGQRLQIPKAAPRYIVPSVLKPSMNSVGIGLPMLDESSPECEEAGTLHEVEILPEALPASPGASTAAPVQRAYCLECGTDVSRQMRIQVCHHCGSVMCSAACLREHCYHAHP